MRAAHCVRINRIPRPNVVTAATIPLALGLVVDVYVVITKIVGSRTGGLIAGSLALVLLSDSGMPTLWCSVLSKPYCPVKQSFLPFRA
jgi:hypothetical protein